MGYNAGGTYFENHRSSGFDTVGIDVSCVVELRRSKRQAGGMMPNTVGMEFDIDAFIMQRTVTCRERFSVDEQFIPDPNVTFAAPVEPCPCTLRQARKDPRFTTDTMFRPDSTCFNQTSAVSGFTPLMPITYGQQCCYNSSG